MMAIDSDFAVGFQFEVLVRLLNGEEFDDVAKVIDAF